jgi:hypothetical protein
MIKTLLTAAAIAIASLGAAHAMSTSSSLVLAAQAKIDAVGLSADAADLTNAQLAEIRAIDVDGDETDALLRGRIAAAVAR